MNIYQRIKELADAKHQSIAEVERVLGFSNGLMYKWSKTSPSIDKVKQVADYFGVSTDFLLGRDINAPRSKASDPVSYYRIDTNGLSSEDVDDLKRQLDDYTEFLKSKLRRKEEDDH